MNYRIIKIYFCSDCPFHRVKYRGRKTFRFCKKINASIKGVIIPEYCPLKEVVNN